MTMDWRDGSGVRLAITSDLEAAARLWVASIEVEQSMAGDPQFLAVRYEDLVSRPDREIRRVFDFLKETPVNATFFPQVAFDADAGENEPSNERVAKPIDTASIGRWRRDLNSEAVRIIERVAGSYMAQRGYV